MRVNAELLFSQEKIQWTDFLSLITYAVIPLRTRSKGIDCITGFFGIIPKNGVPSVFWAQGALSTDKRELLVEILPYLPSLKYPISEVEASKFIDAFLMMEKRPNWIPRLLRVADIERDEYDRRQQFRSEKKDIEMEIKDKDFYAVNQNYQFVQKISGNTYISREQAVAYVKKKGLYSKLMRMAEDASEENYVRVDYLNKSSFSPSDGKHLGLSNDLINYGMPLPVRYQSGINTQTTNLGGLKVPIVEDNYPEEISNLSDSLKIKNPRDSYPRSVDEGDFVDATQSESELKEEVMQKKLNVNSQGKNSDVGQLGSSKTILKKNAMTDGMQATNQIPETNSIRLQYLTLKEVVERVKMSRGTINNMGNVRSPYYNSGFPKKKKVGRSIFWLEHELDAWILSGSKIKN